LIKLSESLMLTGLLMTCGLWSRKPFILASFLLFKMKRDVFAKRWQLRDFLLPLLALPYGFLGIYLYENGFDWIVAVLAVVLLIVIPAIIAVLWDKI